MNKTLLTLLASAFFTATAMASEGMSFDALDKDGNGAISAEEATEHQALTEAWTTVDANQDGIVDKAEFSALEMTETK